MNELNAEQYQRARELAAAAGLNADFAPGGPAAAWIDNLADTAQREVDDAAARDNLHDPREECNNPEQLVTGSGAATRTAAWALVSKLHVWQAVDWDVLLGQGWMPEPDNPKAGSVHGPVVACLVAPADPSEMADMMLHQMAERVTRLAVERRKAELEELAEEQEDMEDEQ